jgi:hypothetical protein
MSRRCLRLPAVVCAILVVADATPAGASTLTYTAVNCTSFTLGGVGGGTPASLKLVDEYCSSFSLTGVAPDQVLVCNGIPGAKPALVNAVSRKVHNTAGTFDLPLSLAPGN